MDVGIVASYCVYRDAQFLRSSLDSLSNYVDVIYIDEGRFRGFPVLPEDGTDEIISDVASRFDPRIYTEDHLRTLRFPKSQKFAILRSPDHLTETEKRTRMLRNIGEKEGAYAFIIDGDEILIGDVKRAFDKIRAANGKVRVGWVFVEEMGNPGYKPRLIRMEKGLHYGKNYWTILREDESVFTNSVFEKESEDQVRLTDFKIFNFGAARSGERGKARVAYRELLSKTQWNQ